MAEEEELAVLPRPLVEHLLTLSGLDQDCQFLRFLRKVDNLEQHCPILWFQRGRHGGRGTARRAAAAARRTSTQSDQDCQLSRFLRKVKCCDSSAADMPIDAQRDVLPRHFVKHVREVAD